MPRARVQQHLTLIGIEHQAGRAHQGHAAGQCHSIDHNLDDVVIKNNKIQVGLSDDDSSTGDDGFGITTYYNETPAQFTQALTVTNNIFEPLTSTGTRAFYINPGVNLFTFTNNAINGDFFGRAWTGAANGLVENNTVTGTGSSGGLGATGYPTASSFGQTTFRANTISGVASGISVNGANGVTITRNVITTSATGIDVFNSNNLAGFDPSTVHANRNRIAVGGGNTGISADAAFVRSVDGMCNWWGNAHGPGSIASGSGSHVTSNVDYAPWLQSSNLDGQCSQTGNLTIILQTHPEGPQAFSFTGTNGIGAFTLVDDGTPANTKTWSKPAGIYTFRVGALPKWALISLTCDSHQTILKSHRLVQIQLDAGDDVTCTFTESYRIPDAMIAISSGGPYSGDNIYSGAVLPSQTLTQSLAPGQTKSFFVKFQNDGLDTDTFRVASKLKGSLKYHVVFMAGTVEITGKVNAGTYKFKLAPGATRMIEIRVTADATTGASESRNIVLTQQSKTAPDARDTVKAFVNAAP